MIGFERHRAVGKVAELPAIHAVDVALGLQGSTPSTSRAASM